MRQILYLKKLKKLPFTLLGIICIICSIGFIILYSAADSNIYPWTYKQIINFVIFFPIALIVAVTDLKLIFKLSYLFYFAILVLLFGVELFGSVSMGAKRWIDLGLVRIQPSELTKLAIILMLARYFHQLKSDASLQFKQILPPVIAIIIPAFLIIKQPDLGTGIITLIIAVTIVFAAGLQIWYFITAGLITVSCIPIIWHMMHDYQKNRVLVFLNPEKEPLGAGYNIIQSKIAIGSGGLFGKGFTNGTQSHLKFLPEHQTDFIFATLSEEFGFAGGLLLISLYGIAIFISLMIAVNCKTIFSKLLVIGVTASLFSHVFINIAMVMGILPVVGVPLPFVSFGGTMMGSMLIGFGLIMNAQIHRNNNV
jgi:rod shape determining protein RodA